MSTIKIVAVDDHNIFLTGLVQSLQNYEQSIDVVGTASCEQELFKLLESNTKPDVLLLDYDLKDQNGIDIGKKLKRHCLHRNIKIIILSAHKSHILHSKQYELIIAAIDAGLDGYVVKDSSIENIIKAIHSVYNGENFVMGETINIAEVNQVFIKDRRRILQLFVKHNNFGLTAREIQVISMLSKGYSSKEIANELKISEEAITNHKDNIKLKLKERYNITLKNVVELVVWAIRNKVIDL